jgi:hypothetical protein
MHVPDLGVGRRYGVETMILVLPIVKHTTFPSVATSEQVKVPRNMRLTFATVLLLDERPCAPLTFRSGLTPPSSGP